MSLQDRLRTLAAIKFMLDRLADVEKVEKQALRDEVGSRMGGTAAVLPDGSEGATVSITKPTHHKADPGGVPYVANPQQFLAWAESVDPSCIVKSVRSTDVPRLLDLAARNLTETGDLAPGVELTEPKAAYDSGGGVVQVRQTDEQAANTLRALTAGSLPLPSLAPQIEGE